MKQCLVSFVFFLSLITSCSYASGNLYDQIKRDISHSQKINQPITLVINLSGKISINTTIDTTSKGNGTIDINGLVLRIYDQHDDGITYADDLLNITIKDINNDGIKDFVFSGQLKFTGEKETDPVRFEPVTVIYGLECESGLFILINSNSEYSIEVLNNQINPISCH